MKKNFKKNIKYGKIFALREFLIKGNKISRLESIIYFGVQNLPEFIRQMKKEGFLISKRKVTMANILRRVNKSYKCLVPKKLPTRDILMMEWWLNR